MDFDT